MAAIPQRDLETALRVLNDLQKFDRDHPDYLRAEQAVAQLVKSGKKRKRKQRRAIRIAADRELESQTSTYNQPVRPATLTSIELATEEPTQRQSSRKCYICDVAFREVDSHYHALCGTCAERNRFERAATGDLSGRTALVTGGRIKIGFYTALKLLRCGADVIVSTRFPIDAQHRFANEPDASTWIDRLAIHQADFLCAEDVNQLIDSVAARWSHLDILVNNAAQTIQRPTQYYRDVLNGEQRSSPALTAPIIGRSTQQAISHSVGSERSEGLKKNELARRSASMLHSQQKAETDFFPIGSFDETGEQLDLRPRNSWSLSLHEVEPREWLETHVIGAFVPYLLIRGLRSLMLASPNPDRYIVNVSAMEGVFNRPGKTPRHPHTNAAKAALNMITRTSSSEYQKDRIYMTAVDTGWITDERAFPSKEREKAAGFRPPLDVVDGASRVCHPIFAGVKGKPIYGVFLKDYEVSSW